MNYIIIITIIGLLILIHEAGHFIFAKLTGIPVATFSIGFGPKLVRWKRNETEYCISIIPIGGYILPAVKDENEFNKISAVKRIIFSFGGPFANIVSCAIIFLVLSAINTGISINIIIEPVTKTLNYLKQIIASLPLIFKDPEKISGIVGIISSGSQMITMKLQNAMHIFALLSLNLAVFNLLPIPALDGGKIILYLLEKIHPKFFKIQIPLTIAGWVLIFGLLIYSTINDIAKLFA